MCQFLKGNYFSWVWGAEVNCKIRYTCHLFMCHSAVSYSMLYIQLELHLNIKYIYFILIHIITNSPPYSTKCWMLQVCCSGIFVIMSVRLLFWKCLLCILVNHWAVVWKHLHLNQWLTETYHKWPWKRSHTQSQT